MLFRSFCTWLLMGYFRSIPYELEECALIDGATRFEILMKIILPLSVPGLISAGIFAFTLSWNEFIYALTFISSSEVKTVPVGVVTAINGATRYQIEIEGMAGHSGTVPMHLRRDALAAAAECVLAIEGRASSEPDLVATVGKLEALPGAINVIPGKVRFTLDVRAPVDAQRQRAAQDMTDALSAICASRGVTLAMTVLHENRIAGCAPWLMQQLDAAVTREGIKVHRLPSGAGHDGMAMQALCDIGMLFVRCLRGISHNPAESVTPHDVEAGARVLLGFIETLQGPARDDAAARAVEHRRHGARRNEVDERGRHQGEDLAYPTEQEQHRENSVCPHRIRQTPARQRNAPKDGASEDLDLELRPPATLQRA